MPVLTIIIVGILYAYFSANQKFDYNWDGILGPIKDTVLTIANNEYVVASYVGVGAITPLQYYRSTWLINMATIDELTKLTKYPDGAVKAIAYEGLFKRDSTRRFEILMAALNDSTTFFNYQEGCVGEMSMLGEHQILNVLRLHHGFKFPPPIPDGNTLLDFSDDEIKAIESKYTKIIGKKQEFFRGTMNKSNVHQPQKTYRG